MPDKRILVIEDEQIVARDLQNLLRRLGYIPLGPATNAEDGIRIAAEAQPDLILMDVRLDSEMDGVQASIEIARNRAVPIIYVTAYPNRFLQNPAGMVYPFLCVAKPFSAATVEAAIESVIHGPVPRPN